MPVELVRLRLRGELPPRELKPSWRFYPLGPQAHR
jgi:hypothetical protein